MAVPVAAPNVRVGRQGATLFSGGQSNSQHACLNTGMSNNTRLNPGSLGDLIATEDIAGVKIPVSKIVLGNAGENDGDVSQDNPLPVANPPVSSIYISNVGGSSFNTIYAGPGFLWGWQIQNTTTASVYVQVFDSLAPTVGTTTPAMSLWLPPSGGIDAFGVSPFYFATGITVSCTTTPTGSTAPASAINLNFFYNPGA